MKKTLPLILLALLSMACSLLNQLPTPGGMNNVTETARPSLSPTITSTTPAQVCTVTAEHLNLRNGPGMEWGSIAILNNGETVTILSEPAQGSNWINVRVGRHEGWINQIFCEQETR